MPKRRVLKQGGLKGLLERWLTVSLLLLLLGPPRYVLCSPLLFAAGHHEDRRSCRLVCLLEPFSVQVPGTVHLVVAPLGSATH
jgi:hypothetical protein